MQNYVVYFELPTINIGIDVSLFNLEPDMSHEEIAVRAMWKLQEEGLSLPPVPHSFEVKEF